LAEEEEEREGEDLESKPTNAEEISDEAEEGTSNEKFVRGEDDEEEGEGDEG